LYLFLLHKTDVFTRPIKVLHVAPEARLSKILSERNTIDYLTADLQSQHVMVKMDITAIQFPDDCFDAIICNHVLEHVVQDRAAMAELYRTLAPGGWAILQVPMSLKLERTYEDSSKTTTGARETAFGQHDHVRIYARDYTDRLEQAGFRIHVFYWTKDAQNFGGRKNRYGLNEQEGVYFATKPTA
jgi:predicted SAM-dependent methyltransferase